MISFILASTDHGPLLMNRLDYNEGFGGGFYGVGAQLMDNSCYDPREVTLLKQLLLLRREHFGDGVCAIDCGANIGVHTLEWSRLMRGWGQVLAFEAQERIFYALAGNLVLQNCRNATARWAAVDAAVGEIAIPEPSYDLPSSFGSFELKQRVGTENIGQQIDYDSPTSRVVALTIDSLVLERVDLIKLDIEGMEMDGLRGAAETIARCKPVLFVEAIKVDRKELDRFCAEHDYRCFPHGMNVLAVHKDDPVMANLEVGKVAA